MKRRPRWTHKPNVRFRGHWIILRRVGRLLLLRKSFTASLGSVGVHLTSSSHRLSTITKANQIIVLHQGRIVEKGTHEELLAANGMYSQMWAKQTKAKEKKDSNVTLVEVA